ncbi:Uncharacterized membrane protein YhfC [Stigmatella aurantiaca]|uniref:Uncharacterized membrane protein YhfC n=1 Tax=Stigmatella aurantiaca TaxID=41 RepID=A0A1H7SUJ4_STIAU|nr:YhfC family glutamic-type intramembrane protease [Stigmatella aurantiaca]SEL76312.1 Uncharacterized membrane protein YhfC [Stigmatella aurantiaca]
MTSGPDPSLVASYLVAIGMDVLMPVALVWWARRRLGVAWRVVVWGALAFAGAQLFTRVPAVQVLQHLWRETLKASPVLTNLWLTGLSLTAGLFEETARLLAFRYPLKGFRRWRDAVGFGIGHGGLESALLVGGLAIIGLVNVVVLSRLDPLSLPLQPEQLEQVRAAKAQVAALRWWEPLLGAVERVGAMAVHVAMSVVVLQRFLRDQRRWYWLAVGFHAVLNLSVTLVAREAGAVAAEGVMSVFALVALGLTLWLRSEDEAPQPGPG